MAFKELILHIIFFKTKTNEASNSPELYYSFQSLAKGFSQREVSSIALGRNPTEPKRREAQGTRNLALIKVNKPSQSLPYLRDVKS